MRLIMAGMMIPVLAAGMQVHMGLSAPNFTQVYRLAQTRSFLRHPASMLLKESFWRCSIILQYTGISVLSVLPIAFARRKQSDEERTGSRQLPGSSQTIWNLRCNGPSIAVPSMTGSPREHRDLIPRRRRDQEA